MKIVVDAMGGDHAPDVVVAGAVAEARSAARRSSWSVRRSAYAPSSPSTAM